VARKRENLCPEDRNGGLARGRTPQPGRLGIPGLAKATSGRRRLKRARLDEKLIKAPPHLFAPTIMCRLPGARRRRVSRERFRRFSFDVENVAAPQRSHLGLHGHSNPRNLDIIFRRPAEDRPRCAASTPRPTIEKHNAAVRKFPAHGVTSACSPPSTAWSSPTTAGRQLRLETRPKRGPPPRIVGWGTGSRLSTRF